MIEDEPIYTQKRWQEMCNNYNGAIIDLCDKLKAAIERAYDAGCENSINRNPSGRAATIDAIFREAQGGSAP